MHFARTLVVAAIGGLFGPALDAQNVAYYGNASPTTGALNAYPMGKEGIRSQQLIPGSVFGGLPVVINDLYFNSAPWTTNSVFLSQVYYDDIEIRMSSTSVTSLTNDWAVNAPLPTTVYRGPLLVDFEGDAWSPIGMPGYYVWVPLAPGDNLVVDIIIWSVADTGAQQPDSAGHFWYLRTDTNTGLQRAVRDGWVYNQQSIVQAVDTYGAKMGFLLFDGQFVPHVGSCPGSSGSTPKIEATPGTWPQPNSSFDVLLSDGPSNSIAALMLSLETNNYLGVQLPFDMGAIGAPGCTMWQGTEVAFSPVATGAFGSATHTLQFPNGFPLGVNFYGTWLTLDPTANALGIVPSGFATMSL